METIPQYVVDHYVREGYNHENTVPHVIYDPNPIFKAIGHEDWEGRTINPAHSRFLL